MNKDKGPNGWTLFGAFLGFVVFALVIEGLTVGGVGFGPLFISFQRSDTRPGPPGPAPPVRDVALWGR